MLQSHFTIIKMKAQLQLNKYLLVIFLFIPSFCWAGIDAFITDPRNQKRAETRKHSIHQRGVVVYNMVYSHNPNITIPFINDTYGIDMNQDASSGVTEGVHDGLDSTYWTASTIVGTKFTFNSGAQAECGSQSVLSNGAGVGNVMQFLNPSGVTTFIPSNVSLSMFIYVDSGWGLLDSISIQAHDTTTGQDVGDEVFLEDYFEFGVFDTWHQLRIPLVDMDIAEGTLNSFQISIVAKSGAAPIWYLDCFGIDQGTAPIEFTVKPAGGTWLYITGVKQIFVNNVASTVANGTMPGLSYDTILGVSLPIGYRYELFEGSEVVFIRILSNLFEILQHPRVSIMDVVSDGTNTILTVKQEFETPLILRGDKSAKFSITVQDDMSGFLQFRSYVEGYIEKLEQ